MFCRFVKCSFFVLFPACLLITENIFNVQTVKKMFKITLANTNRLKY